jgi:hypothetical protein
MEAVQDVGAVVAALAVLAYPLPRGAQSAKATVDGAAFVPYLVAWFVAIAAAAEMWLRYGV